MSAVETPTLTAKTSYSFLAHLTLLVKVMLSQILSNDGRVVGVLDSLPAGERGMASSLQSSAGTRLQNGSALGDLQSYAGLPGYCTGTLTKCLHLVKVRTGSRSSRQNSFSLGSTLHRSQYQPQPQPHSKMAEPSECSGCLNGMLMVYAGAPRTFSAYFS